MLWLRCRLGFSNNNPRHLSIDTMTSSVIENERFAIFLQRKPLLVCDEGLDSARWRWCVQWDLRWDPGRQTEWSDQFTKTTYHNHSNNTDTDTHGDWGEGRAGVVLFIFQLLLLQATSRQPSRLATPARGRSSSYSAGRRRPFRSSGQTTAGSASPSATRRGKHTGVSTACHPRQGTSFRTGKICYSSVQYSTKL